MHIDALLLYLLAAVPLLATASTRPKNAILLSEVQTLTLRGNGAKTSHRRVSAIPQLKCVSDKRICGLYQPEVMRCTNQGSSYGDEDIEWSCAASLPAELKLGSTDVICEGYASADDPYVLKGSCGVEYRLQLTELGEKRYADIANPTRRLFSDGEGGTDMSAWIFTLVFVGILGWIIYSACIAARTPRQPQRRRRGGYGGGGGGGGGGWGPGWGSDNDPPPPYPGTKPSSSTQRQGWNPGFWSGLAGGAAAGYFAGNRGRNNDRTRDLGSGWGNTRSSFPASSSTTGPSSPQQSSSSTRESTGFGSTRRR